MKINVWGSARTQMWAWDIVIPYIDFNDWIEAPRLVVDCPISKQCRGYYSMQSDITRIKEIATELLKNPDWEFIDILWEHSIILYWKLFASAKWWRWIKLDTSDLNHLEKWPKDFHAHVIHLRNEFVAHAWKNWEELTQSMIVFVPEEIEESAKEITWLFCCWTKSVWWRWVEDFKRMIALCDLVNWIVEEKYKKVEARLLAENRSKDRDELFSKAQTTTQRIEEMKKNGIIGTSN